MTEVTQQELVDLRANLYAVKHSLNDWHLVEAVVQLLSSIRKLTEFIERGGQHASQG